MPTSVTTPTAWPVPRSLTFVATAGLISTQTILTQLGSMFPVAMECSMEPRQSTRPAGLQQFGISVLRGIHVRNGFRQRTVVAQAARQHERHVVFHALVHDAGFQPAAFHGAAYAAGVVNRIDGAHVIAMAMLGLAPVCQTDAERGAEQSRFDVVNAEGVAAEHGIHPARRESAGRDR